MSFNISSSFCIYAKHANMLIHLEKYWHFTAKIVIKNMHSIWKLQTHLLGMGNGGWGADGRTTYICVLDIHSFPLKNKKSSANSEHDNGAKYRFCKICLLCFPQALNPVWLSVPSFHHWFCFSDWCSVIIALLYMGSDSTSKVFFHTSDAPHLTCWAPDMKRFSWLGF